MRGALSTAGTAMSRAEKILLALLVLSMFINYADRGNLSIAAPLLETELSLTPAQLGSLLGSFFWTYALFQLFGIAGWLADRFPVGLVIAAGFFVWSSATAVTGVVSGFTGLFIMRLLLGAGESVAYPCYAKILATDFPEHHRGLANSLLDAGSKMGPALGTLLGGLLVARLGWRVFFIALGIGGLVWLIPWFRNMPRHHSSAIYRNESSPSVLQILSVRSAWGSFLGLFCANYFWFFLLTWLPTYLVKARGFSMDGMATVGFVAYFAIAGATVVAGWTSDRMIRSGQTARVRKRFVVAGLTFSTIILPVAVVQNGVLSIALLFAACTAFGVFASNHWAITQTLAGPLAAGRWTSLQNGVGNLAGIAAPWVTGEVVQATGSFHLAFVVAACVVLTGAVMYGWVMGPVEEVPWGRARR